MHIHIRHLRAPGLTELKLVEDALPTAPEAVAAAAPHRASSPFLGRRLTRYVERRGELLAAAGTLQRNLFEPCTELEAMRKLQAAADAQRLAREAWSGVADLIAATSLKQGKS